MSSWEKADSERNCTWKLIKKSHRQIPVRKVPIALKKPIKDEIDRLVKLDVLAKVDVPMDWISSMVTVKKSDGSIRLCIDPKPLNKALGRNHYPHPDIEDVLPNLSSDGGGDPEDTNTV